MGVETKSNSTSVMAAFGLGVSDLERSVDFYGRVVGMMEQRRFSVATMDEVVIGFKGQTPLLLMHYTDGSVQHYNDNPVKLVMYVDDPRACVERVRSEGLTVLREPFASPEMGGAWIALAKDPDGYILEFIQRTES